MVEILANDLPVARGQIVVNGNRIAVEISEMIRKPVPLPGSPSRGVGAGRSTWPSERPTRHAGLSAAKSICYTLRRFEGPAPRRTDAVMAELVDALA